jgi:hypothetical protein
MTACPLVDNGGGTLSYMIIELSTMDMLLTLRLGPEKFYIFDYSPAVIDARLPYHTIGMRIETTAQ